MILVSTIIHRSKMTWLKILGNKKTFFYYILPWRILPEFYKQINQRYIILIWVNFFSDCYIFM